ncbi:ferritin-like domain-containing protein [Paraflavitalea pollutisoli]|uniref:YciE/YciF ferroxidase family protein n=1 Tax=Paraflavitalea pollutisoli TaxID=3034143 RepID=UPI0023EC8739|nr:ferritin-like domain-containing protein [Paraflavitalea sp. H1-2-19X]
MPHNSGTEDNNLMPYFVHAIKRLHWAEKQTAMLLDKMRGEAFANSLKKAIEVHQAQTADHILRLEQVLQILGETVTERICEAMQGLVKDTSMILGDTVRKTRSRDLGIRAALMKVEHYEMATYVILVQLAQAMGLPDAEQLLQQTLIEEKEMEEKLQQPPA